jgi:hypothetical protein
LFFIPAENLGEAQSVTKREVEVAHEHVGREATQLVCLDTVGGEVRDVAVQVLQVFLLENRPQFKVVVVCAVAVVGEGGWIARSNGGIV